MLRRINSHVREDLLISNLKHADQHEPNKGCAFVMGLINIHKQKPSMTTVSRLLIMF